MASYQDIIGIRGGRAAYHLESESVEEWKSFIPNDQFNGVLNKVLQSVRGNDINVHKSFWLYGTYGTGKSHAAAVISHLLGDPVPNISKWVEDEYGAEQYGAIKSTILSLREQKRLLTVKLYGLESMTHSVDLALVVQQAVLAALRKEGMEFPVSSDFETSIENISLHPDIWQRLISSHPQLESVAPSVEKLISLLKQGDINTYHRVVDALRNSGLGALRQDNAKLKDWLVEVQDKLAESSEYCGLLIIWDEFTDVMRVSLGIQVLKELQEIAETFMASQNNSYLFLVSHPSAFDQVGAEEQLKQTDGRYHRIKYNMEPASAFRIMSGKFKIRDRARHKHIQETYYDINKGLLETYICNSNDKKASEEDLRNLFPLHPGTANLATHYATVVGSATRGVFEFLAQNDAIGNFLSDPDKLSNCDTITADYLWDYILKDLQDDVVKYGAVTERYNSYVNRVRNEGDAYFAIFKSILLLNAFNNIAAGNNYGLITPSEENVRMLYTGTRYAKRVDTVLQWLSDEAIIQRAPGGLYSVLFTALPTLEIENKKHEMRSVQFLHTYSIANFGADNMFERKFLPNSLRPFGYNYFSDEGSDAVLRNKIKKRRKDTKACDLYFALFLARNNDECARLKTFAEACAGDEDDKDLKNIIFIVFDEVFSDKNYDQFIEYMANQACAESRGLSNQSTSHKKNAEAMVKDWLDSVHRNNATIYINGQGKETRPVRLLPTFVKDYIIPLLYPFAPEAHDDLRNNSPQTFWKTQNSKTIVSKILFAKALGEMLDLNAGMRSIQYLMQDCLDENLQWKSDVSPDHPLKKVCSQVDTIINKADKSQTFNFEERFGLLTSPPYGFYPNFANMAVFAFAMRPWVQKIFDMQGKPRDENAMVEDIDLLFKVWDGSKKANGKLSFKFQTQEEGKLCKELVSLFSLDKKNKEYSDISSLTNAKYAMVNFYLKENKAPLWALKYVPASTFADQPLPIEVSEPIKRLIDNVVSICSERELRNPALINDTLKLIAEQRMDMMNILNVESAFSDGFRQFLLDIELANIKEEELAEVQEYILGHSEASVGYWTEQAVITHAKDWRLAQGMARPAPAPEEEPDSPQPGSGSSGVKPTAPDKLEQMRSHAKYCIAQLRNLDEAKSILYRLCDEGNEWLLNRMTK